MRFKLNAASRLLMVKALNTNLDTPNGEYGGDGIGKFSNDYDLVDAAFDNSRDQTLGELLPHLKQHGLCYVLKDSCLIYRVPMRKGEWLAKQTVQVLQAQGIKFYIRDNALELPKFSIKGPDGIVYQRLDAIHRIFYTR